MSLKTPAVAYYTRKIKTTSHSQIIAEWQDAPISELDFAFLKEILAGKTYKELSALFGKSEARIYQWKRNLFEHLHKYDMNKSR